MDEGDATIVDLLEENLLDQVKLAKEALKRHRIRKRKITESVQASEPHEEASDDEEAAAAEKKTEKVKKTKKTPLTGPCEGRIWLTPMEKCPGASAGRGRNPEADATTFMGAVFEKKRHVFCKSCKNEYVSYKKNNKK